MVREGDPLAPFLFILDVEALHVTMEEAKQKGIFLGIKLPNSGPEISHLQYADDATFFGQWSLNNVQNLVRILRCFEHSSGLKVNLEKSKLFGFATPAADLHLVARRLHCQIGALPLIYLGLPVGAQMSRPVHWYPILHKFRSKLSKWKASTLYYGGMLTLCKSVLSSLGMYFFSLAKAPIKVIKEPEKMRMRFFLGQ